MSLRFLVLPYAVKIDVGEKISLEKKKKLNEYALSFLR